jgi:hypothetical protein
MKTRILHLLLVLLASASVTWGQHDFSVRWNTHETGDTVDENPFNGSFTITNIGSTTIPMNDTLWYGYMINGEKYDLTFYIDAVSGEVLEADFAPEEEISVINNFDWPLLWESGATIEICATVYGVTYASHTGELFTGDLDSLNNRDCLFAVLPEYAVGLSEKAHVDEFELFYNLNREIVLINHTDKSALINSCTIYNTSGKQVFSKNGFAPVGKTSFSVESLSPGFYIAQLNMSNQVYKLKFVVSN